MRNRWFTPSGRVAGGLVTAGILLFGISCSDSPTESNAPSSPSPDVSATSGPLSFGIGEAGNGSGQCLLADAQDAGFLQNLTSLNCTSNDVDISFAEVTLYSINDPDPIDGFTELPFGEEIDCVPGDVIFAVTDAKIANNASERYDLGLWINPNEGGSALTGDSPECLHFNLIPDQNGSTTEEEGGTGGTPDACGDVSADADTITVPLDTLTLICPAGGATTVTVDACAAWSNGTTGGNDRVCPVNPPGGSEGFRLGTTPGTTAKCRCEPLDLPINVKGVIRVDKVTVPAADPQSFAFAATGADFATPFNLTDASTPHSSGPLNTGTYGITETVPTGWELTGRSCVFTGTTDPADFSLAGANGVSVDLGSGEDVTCTFTNTKQASVTIKKVTNPAENPAVGSFTFTQNFDASGNFSLGHDGTKVFSNVTSGAAKTVVEVDPTPAYDLTAISCTGATTYTGTVATRTLSVTPGVGEVIVCTFTNTRRGTVIIKKETDPNGATGTFNFTTALGNFSLSDGGEKTFTNVTIGAHSVTESDPVPSGFDLVASGDGHTTACVDATTNSSISVATRTASINVAAGETVTCTFVNRQRATVEANKTVSSGTLAAGQFDFQIRSGASPTEAGTVIATGSNDLAGDVAFACNGSLPALCTNISGVANFVPGNYQFCEVDQLPAWSNNLGGFTPNGDDDPDNGDECVNIALAAGQTGVPTELPDPITNTPPPMGDARTIGYWKNHSCAARGNQDDVLSDNLPIQLTEGGTVADFDWLIADCQTVVTLLDKRALNNNKKMASDAAYGLAAQLAAALLNINATATTCDGAVLPIIDQAQKLLDDINFDGSGQHLRPKDGANYTLANSLAAKLDAYNNNECSAL